MILYQLPANMFRGLLVFIITGLLSSIVHADAWTGPDKVQHATAGAIIGAAVTTATGSALQGCIAATVVGAAKEFYDAAHPARHDASMKDFIVTASFGCASAYTVGWIITPKEIRYTIRF